MRSVQRLAFGGLAVLCLIAGTTVYGQDKERTVPTAKLDKSGAVIVPLQGSVKLQMKNKPLIRSVYFDREGVVQVLPDATNPDSVIVFGRGVGSVTLELTDVDGNKQAFEIVVQQDIDLLRNLIKRAVPTASVEIIPGVGGVLIISGNVARAEDVDTILRIAGAVGGQSANIVNAMTVGGVHQVQLDVTVARVDRSRIRERGVNLLLNGNTASGASVISGSVMTSISANGPVGATPTTTGMLTTTDALSGNLVFGLLPTQFLTAVRALKSEGLAKLLAEPKLVTQSGRPARFLAGGQQATLSGASGINGPGVTYQPIGTELEFLPVVYGNGKIYLEVAPTVRGVNQGLGITTSFGAVPGFDEQTIRTSVVMESGQTFAIGGLIQNTVQSTRASVPVIGELPFIGALFSSSRVEEREQELIIFVTPHLVDPMDCKQLPSRLPGRETRVPDDFEFYLEAMIELPRGQRNVFEGRRYKAAWKNDPTATQFPCGVNGNGGNCSNGVVGVSGTNCANGNCTTTSPVIIRGPQSNPVPVQIHPAPQNLPVIKPEPAPEVIPMIKPLSGSSQVSPSLPPLPRLQ
jgi:pilus assembly protein CpaC